MSDSWDASWWLAEVAADPAYAKEVNPLLIDLLQPSAGRVYLDLGCGEGQGMRSVTEHGAIAIGCDQDWTLVSAAASAGPVVQARLPELNWLADQSVDGTYAVLVLEHLPRIDTLLVQAGRVVRDGGTLVIVANHPAFTAPGAGPLIDPTDGEVTWRWGRYLEPGTSVEPAGSFNLTMHHRPLGRLLSEAAAAGWSLERLVEQGPGAAAISRDPLLEAQRHFPRLLGVRFRNTQAP